MTQPPGLQARIAPATSRDLGAVNAAICRGLGAATGGAAPNIFTTLGRHRRLFRRWLLFAGGLMPGGSLPRADSELLILRVADNCGCAYERDHHERLGRAAGLTAEEVARTREGPDAAGWSPRQALLLRAADELHRDRCISDDSWSQLQQQLSDEQLIELCMLVGHYEMVAMTLNSLKVQRDAAPTRTPSRLAAAAQSLLTRRGRHSGEASG